MFNKVVTVMSVFTYPNIKLLIPELSAYRKFTHFRTMFHFYTPWKCQKTFGFLTFLGGIEMEYWTRLG